MNYRELERLKELALKGKLDEKSRALLLQYYTQVDSAADDELSKLEEDIYLGKLLQQIPDVPVSSNFTARVMNAIEIEEPEPVTAISSIMQILRQNLFQRLAPVAILIILTGFCYFSYTESKKMSIAGSIAELDRVAMLNEKQGGLPVEIFKDFDVIQKINNYNSMVDIELLAALKNQ
ncbi:MAG: hypothetical protein ACP5T0_10520 [Verrucomicrobiia bacterium]